MIKKSSSLNGRIGLQAAAGLGISELKRDNRFAAGLELNQGEKTCAGFGLHWFSFW
jgi:hypothetical protein